MSAAARAAISRLRSRAGRSLLAAAGIVAAAAMLGTAITVSYAFGTGFERSAERADLPDVIARFEEEQLSDVDRRVSALPNLASRSYRLEAKGIDLAAAGGASERGAVHIVRAGRRGYAVTEGRDLSGRSGEVLVERGVAAEWGVEPGEEISVEGLGPQRVVGISVSPDNVAFPLSSDPRIYLAHEGLVESYGPYGAPVNMALVWANDPARIDVTLEQARAVSYGLQDLRFLTQGGIRGLIDQAAGIVIALLVAFSLVALVAAATMLAAGAHADVQRRLPALGVQRALGFSPGRIASVQAVEALLVALPAGALGLAGGALAVRGPTAGLLAALNEQPPGSALLVPLGLALVAIVSLVTAAATWPAWRAARRPPVQTLRGGELGRRRAPRPGAGTGRGGLLAVGARFATAGRARWAAAVATIGVCAAVLILMLALASLLDRLRDDPGTLGKRYQLTAALDPARVGEVRALPGVADAGERYRLEVNDSFRPGEPVRLIAFPGDHTRFEAPPLERGRRLRAAGEVEVGVGLADALGLRPGSALALLTPSGAEVSLRVVGVVRALENDGRIGFARPDRFLVVEPGLRPTVAVRLEPGADRAAVAAGLRALGAEPSVVGGAVSRDGALLGVLAGVLRGVGLAVGLVCLYALVSALSLTARERRGSVALLRALGGDRGSVARLLLGAAAAVVVPAGVLGLVLERFVLGPAVGRLAVGFADLGLVPGPGQVALIGLVLGLVAALATALVARSILREPVAKGLR